MLDEIERRGNSAMLSTWDDVAKEAEDFLEKACR